MTKEETFQFNCSSFYENLNESDSDDDPFSLLETDIANLLDINDDLSSNSDSCSLRNAKSASFSVRIKQSNLSSDSIVQNFIHSIKSNLMNKRIANVKPNAKLNLRDVAARIIQRRWFSYIDKLIFEYTKKILNHCTKNPMVTIKSTNPQETHLFDNVSRTFIRFQLSGVEFPPKIVYNIYANRPIVNIGDSLTLNLNDETKKTSKDFSNYKKCSQQTKPINHGKSNGSDWKTCIDIKSKLMTQFSRSHKKAYNIRRTVSSRTVPEKKLTVSKSSASMTLSFKDLTENSKRKLNKNRVGSSSRKLSWITDIIKNKTSKPDQGENENFDIESSNVILDVPMSVSFSGSTIQSSSTSVSDISKNVKNRIEPNSSLLDDKDKMYSNYSCNDYFHMSNLNFLHLLED